MDNNNIGMVIARTENLHFVTDFELTRTEVCLFDNADKQILQDFIKRNNLNFGIHFPLFRPSNSSQHPLLASIADYDDERSFKTIRRIEDNILLACEMGAEYLVVHTQRPSHFSGDKYTKKNIEKTKNNARINSEKLSKLIEKYNIPIYLENMFDNVCFSRMEDYIKIFSEFKSLGLCLDVGHLGVDSNLYGFDFMRALEQIAPYTKTVHLQNTQGETGFENKHWKVPVNPSQEVSGGWLNIEGVLTAVLTVNPMALINFECNLAYSDSPNFVIEGIEWVKKLYKKIRKEQG